MQKRIAHITDTHLDDKTATSRGIDPKKNLMAVLEAIAENAVDEIVFTGDIGETEAYSWFFKTLEKYKPGYKVVLGNHDDLEAATQSFTSHKTEGQGELYYIHEDELCRYIFMDSSSALISGQQLDWLNQVINSSKKIIIFIHHPILGFETGMDNIYPLHNRDEMVQILQQCKQDVYVFCGHYHMPDKRTEGKIHQCITPAVSFQVKKFSPTIEIKADSFGFRIITVSEAAVKSKLMVNYYDVFLPVKL